MSTDENNIYGDAERLVRAFAKANNCNVMNVNDDNHARRSYRVEISKYDEVSQVRHLYAIGGSVMTFDVDGAFSETLESILAHHHVSVDELAVIADISERV